MDQRELIRIVGDFGQWKGDSYRLAALISAAQKEASAVLAEAEGAPEIATKIREAE